MSLYHTPRTSAWSPPDSLSGTPTSSACSLPRTPTDDAALNPALPHHSVVGRVTLKGREPTSLSFMTQASVLGSRSAALPQLPPPLLPQKQQRASANTSLPAVPLGGLAAPFSHAPASSSSAPLSTVSALQRGVLQPSSQQPTQTPVVGPPRADASTASGHNTTSTGLAPRTAGPGTPKASASATSASGNGAAGVPPSGVSRKRRKRSTPEQIAVLERHFAANDRPTSSAREVIAKEVDMTARQVQVWYANNRQTRKRRLLEAAGQAPYRPSSPSVLGAHPSSDSVGSIPSSEMDDLPFDTVYGRRRVVNKDNVRPLAAPSRLSPVITVNAAKVQLLNPAADAVAPSTQRSPSLPREARSTSQRLPPPATPSASSETAALPRPTASLASSHPAPTLLDKCVQSRELPFVHQKRSRSSEATQRQSGLPVMGWRDQYDGDQPVASSSTGRDVWQHMMSDPPSGGLLELHEDESDDEEDVQPAKVRRTSSSSAATFRHLSVATGQRPPPSRKSSSSLPSHLDQRPSLRRSASLDCTASRSAGQLKRARTALKSATSETLEDRRARRRSSRDTSADSSRSSRSGSGEVAAVSPSADVGAMKPDATDVECARLLMGLLGGA